MGGRSPRPGHPRTGRPTRPRSPSCSPMRSGSAWTRWRSATATARRCRRGWARSPAGRRSSAARRWLAPPPPVSGPRARVAWRAGKLLGPDVAIEAGELAADGELAAAATFKLAAPVYSSGAYGVTVTIDKETGVLSVGRLVAVHDAGTLINPLIAEGQVVGATLQGFAEAVSEQVVYDADGQLLTGSFLSYGILSAAEAP